MSIQDNPPGWREFVADAEGMRPRVVEMQITVGKREHTEVVRVLITEEGIQRWGASLAAIRATVEFTERVRDLWRDSAL